MASLLRRQQRELHEIAEELIAVGGGAPLAELIEAARHATGLQTVALYSIDQVNGALTMRGVGTVQNETGALLDFDQYARRFNEASRTSAALLPYDAFNVAPRERNRVVVHEPEDLVRLLGTIDTRRTVWRPLRLAYSHQVRTLLCEGRRLLGWFGGLQAGAPPPRAAASLRVLAVAMRARLRLERALGCRRVALCAIDMLLDRLPHIAAVVDAHGRPQHANRAARAAHAADRGLFTRELRARPPHGRFIITPARAAGIPQLFVVIEARATSHRAARVAAYGAKIGLTARQNEVLLEIVDGRGNKQIADRLGVALPTVETHVTAILRRARKATRFELASELAAD